MLIKRGSRRIKGWTESELMEQLRLSDDLDIDSLSFLELKQWVNHVLVVIYEYYYFDVLRNNGVEFNIHWFTMWLARELGKTSIRIGERDISLNDCFNVMYQDITIPDEILDVMLEKTRILKSVLRTLSHIDLNNIYHSSGLSPELYQIARDRFLSRNSKNSKGDH